MKIHPVGAELFVPCEWTDRHDEANRCFSQFSPSWKAFTASAFEILIFHSQFYFHIAGSASSAMT